VPKGACELPKWLAAFDDGIVAVGKDNLIYALSNPTGRVRWKVKLPADPSTSPAVQGNEILVGGRDQRVYRLAARDGKIKSSIPVTGVPVGRPLVAGDVAFFILNGTGATRGAVTALSRKGVLWSAVLTKEQSSEQPYAWNGTVVVADCAGTITALGKDTGKSEWTVHLDGCIRSIGGDSTSLYAGAQQGTVFAIQP
jgi:outer membrane protein assembly factor BamB